MLFANGFHESHWVKSQPFFPWLWSHRRTYEAPPPSSWAHLMDVFSCFLQTTDIRVILWSFCHQRWPSGWLHLSHNLVLHFPLIPTYKASFADLRLQNRGQTADLGLPTTRQLLTGVPCRLPSKGSNGSRGVHTANLEKLLMDLHFPKSLDWEIFCFPNPWIETFSKRLLDTFCPFPLQAFDDRVVNFQADLRRKRPNSCSFIRSSAVHSQGKSNKLSVRLLISICTDVLKWDKDKDVCFNPLIQIDFKSSPCPRAWTWVFQYRPNLGMEQWPWDWKARFFPKDAGSKQDWLLITQDLEGVENFHTD